MTTVRFCPSCRADVDDVGGFCLLGHSLPPSPASDPLADLRTEVDLAFEKVQTEMALALDPMKTLAAENASESESEADGMLEEIQVTSKALWASLADESPVAGTDPIVAFAPSPRMDWGPADSKLKRRSGVRRPRPHTA